MERDVERCRRRRSPPPSRGDRRRRVLRNAPRGAASRRRLPRRRAPARRAASSRRSPRARAAWDVGTRETSSVGESGTHPSLLARVLARQQGVTLSRDASRISVRTSSGRRRHAARRAGGASAPALRSSGGVASRRWPGRTSSVLRRPLVHRHQQRLRLQPSGVSEYSTRDRHLGEGPPHDEAVGLERAQRLRERLLRDLADLVEDLAVAPRAAGEQVEDVDAPAAGCRSSSTACVPGSSGDRWVRPAQV